MGKAFERTAVVQRYHAEKEETGDENTLL